MIQSNALNHKTKLILICSIGIIAIIAIIYYKVNYNESNNQTESIMSDKIVTTEASPEKNSEQVIADDNKINEESTTPKNSSLTSDEERQIKNTIIDYFNCTINLDCFQNFYAATLRRVYNKRNLSMDETMNEHRSYYNIYPFQEAIVDQNSIVISKNSDGEIETSFNLETRIKKNSEDDFKRYTSLTHLTFNSDFRIIEMYNEHSRKID